MGVINDIACRMLERVRGEVTPDNVVYRDGSDNVVFCYRDGTTKTFNFDELTPGYIATQEAMWIYSLVQTAEGKAKAAQMWMNAWDNEASRNCDRFNEIAKEAYRVGVNANTVKAFLQNKGVLDA